MKKLILLCLTLSTVVLNACVEVRDPEQPKESTQPEEVRPLIQAEEAPKKAELLIDQEMYVYQGKILTMEQIEDIMPEKSAHVFGIGKIRPAPQWHPTNVVLNYGKIEITARGKLFTMGSDVTLSADVFISNRGSIETFPQGSKAMLNTSGASGGYLTLQIGRGEGQLFVTVRGQEGGDGQNGVDGFRLPPQSLNFCEANISQTMAKLNASPGQAGRNGGDTGSIRIKGDISNFDVRVRREPGKGGKGGAAGVPGRCIDQSEFNQYTGVTTIHWAEGQAAPAGAPGADGRILD